MSDANGPEMSPVERKYVLVVGVRGSDKLPELHQLLNAERDAEDVSSRLRQPECGFESIGGGALHGKKASTQNVKHAVHELIKERKSEDLLLFYFIGHSYAKSTNSGDKIYLVTSDFDPAGVVDQPEFHLSFDWITETFLENRHLSNVIVILDCCNAGEVLEPSSLNTLTRQSIEAVLARLGHHTMAQSTRPWAIIVSTEANAPAFMGKDHARMTGLFLDALKGKDQAALNSDGDLTLFSLFEYLQRRMPRSGAQRQIPIMRGTFSAERTWILARNPIRTDRGSFVPQQADNPSQALVRQFFDETICQEATDADLDMERVGSFLRKPLTQRQEEYSTHYNEQQQMGQLGLLRRGHPSYGALLCFGLRPSRQIIGAYTRCVSWKDPRRELGWWDEEECRGGLFEQFEKAQAFLVEHLGDQVSRGDRPEHGKLDARVLEEALANALIHREYVTEPGRKHGAEGVMVEIFPDRIEISSPGGPPLNIAVLQRADEQPHPVSLARNPQIMRIFYLAGHVEKAGTGVARMQRWMQEAGLPKPDMKLDDLRQTFFITLHRQKAILPGAKEKREGSGISGWLSRFVIPIMLITVLVLGLSFGAAIAIPRWYISTFVPASTTIEIASDFPTSGVDTVIGSPLQNGVQMAIDDANNARVLPGYTFKLAPYNDVGRGNHHDPVVGASDVNKAVADNLVAGIVGPYNSVVAKAELPIVNQAPIALISPSNTYPCLTKNASADPDCSGASNIVAQMRPTGQLTYFRLATTDDLEGKAAADYFFTMQQHHEVLLLKDNTDPYSSGLAQVFQQEWERLGGRVVPLVLPENTSSIPEYQTKLQTEASLQPDLIYFAGDNPYGTYVLRALANIPLLKNVTFAGADGIVDSNFLQTAASLQRDAPVYASAPTQDPAHSGQTVGTNFESNYIANGYSNYRPYAASAYACTMMLIQAIKTAIQKGTSTPHGTQDQAGARQFRLAILQVLAHLRYTGPTGAQSFDANGDTTNHTITFYLLDLFNGQADWKWLQQVSDEETSATSFAMRCNRPRAFFCSMMS